MYAAGTSTNSISKKKRYNFCNVFAQVNFHPVKVAVTIKKSGVLLEHIPEVINVLGLMAGREMNKVSFKLWLHNLSIWVVRLSEILSSLNELT